MNIGMMLAFVVTGQASAPQMPARSAERVTVVRESEVPRLDPLGNCEGNGASFDLRRLMLIENRSIRMEGAHGELQVSVNREQVRIDAVRDGSAQPVYSTNIGYAAEPHGDLDVELKLGYLDGAPIVYWKETFQNRIYRQGLFRIVGERVEQLCAGRGGITTVE